MDSKHIDPRAVVPPIMGKNTLSEEDHMAVFARLARVKNMHGTPGDQKKKGK